MLVAVMLVAPLTGCEESTTAPISDSVGGGKDAGVVCGPGASACDGQCVNLSQNPLHCGKCGNSCQAGEVCSTGKCAVSCQSGLTNCSGACVNVQTDTANCGACAAACNAGEVCSAGKCVLSCPPPQTKCGGGDASTPYCANLTNDNSNCGTCATACKTGQVCVAGACALACPPPQTRCSGGDAGAPFCANLSEDNSNCGACAAACKAGELCSGGKCALSCQSGLSNCSGKCVDLQTDLSNCGTCAAACKAGEICSSGKCVLSCQSGLTDCNGVCVNLQTDLYNCGTCGTACTLGLYCCAGGCVDPISNTSHCGGCNKACSQGEQCIAGKCLGYGVTIAALGCRYVDVKNSGVLPLTTFTVTVDSTQVPITAPSSGIAAGQQGRIYLAYVVASGQKVTVAAHGVSAAQTQSATCAINLGFAKYGDQGGDELAFIRTIATLGSDFATKTGLKVSTKTVSSTACSLTEGQYLLDVDTDDLTNVDLIYYHSHNNSVIGTVFKPSTTALKKLYDWVSQGGLLIFDDCGGMTSADLTSSFGVTVGLDGSTGDTSTASQFMVTSDIYVKPYAFTTATFSTTAGWTEGGQTSLTGGVKEIVRRGSSGLLSGKKVGHGYIAFMGGDWGCSLACGCSAGTTQGYQLLLNFAYIASGRAILLQ